MIEEQSNKNFRELPNNKSLFDCSSSIGIPIHDFYLKMDIRNLYKSFEKYKDELYNKGERKPLSIKEKKKRKRKRRLNGKQK